MKIAFLRRFIWAVDGVIIALLVFVAGYIFLSLGPKGEEGLLEEEAAIVERLPQPREEGFSLQDYSVIWKNEPETIVSLPGEGLPEAAQVREELARLVKVRGTLIEPTFGNFVILEDLSKKRQKSYQEGEFLGEVKIRRVMKDSVIFEFKGQEIALSVEPDTSPVQVASATGVVKLAVMSQPPEEPPQIIQPMPKFTPPPPEPAQAAVLPEPPEITPPPEEPPQEPVTRPAYTLPTTEDP